MVVAAVVPVAAVTAVAVAAVVVAAVAAVVYAIVAAVVAVVVPPVTSAEPLCGRGDRRGRRDTPRLAVVSLRPAWRLRLAPYPPQRARVRAGAEILDRIVVGGRASCFGRFVVGGRTSYFGRIVGSGRTGVRA